MSTINFNNVNTLTNSINEALTARGLNCQVKHINDDEVALQFKIKPGEPSMLNAAWILMQNRRADGILCTLDEVDDAVYGVLYDWKLQPVSSEYKVDHDSGTYTLPLEPLVVKEPKKAEKSELQAQFEAECEAAFPGHFDFKLFPDGTYHKELTRYTFAGYELAHKNMANNSGTTEPEVVDDGSGNLILIFEEVRIYNEGTEYYREETFEFKVSTRKLAAFEQDSGGYDYVKHIVDAALAGTPIHASKKYSFSDTPDWWEGLKPDANCKDPIKRFEYEIHC